MKFFAIALAALFGSLVGAGVVNFVRPAETGTTQSVSPPPLDGCGADPARLESENEALRKRLDSVERALNERLVAKEGTEQPQAVDLAALRAELLKEVKEQARIEAKAAAENAAAQPASGPIGEPLDRDALIANAYAELTSPEASARRAAIRTLRKLKVADAGGQLIAALSDADLKVQGEASKFFEEYWNEAALEPLVKVLNGPDPRVGELALDALCKSGSEQAQQELENYYATGTDLELAYEAGKALEENDRHTMLPTGAQRFRDALQSTDPNKRELGVRGLRRWGSAADESLLRALENDPHPGVREEARAALKAWGLK